MTGPNSRAWNTIGLVEDCLALVLDIETHRRNIERLALYGLSHDEIHEEALLAEADVKRTKLALKRLRDGLVDRARV